MIILVKNTKLQYTGNQIVKAPTLASKRLVDIVKRKLQETATSELCIGSIVKPLLALLYDARTSVRCIIVGVISFLSVGFHIVGELRPQLFPIRGED